MLTATTQSFFIHSSLQRSLSLPPLPSTKCSNPNFSNITLKPSFFLRQFQTLDSDSSTPMHSQPPPSTDPSPENLNHLSFNQDHACFAAATDAGFRVLSCDPFRELFRREFVAGGGISMAEMLFLTNVIAIVGRSSGPQFSPNKVMVWDDHQGRCFGELSFRSAVRAVRLRPDRIVVVLEMKVFVYNFVDFKLLHQVETNANPKGLCALSQLPDSVVMACPGLLRGQVRVDLYALRKTNYISAHDSSLACLALTRDGKFLATASTKGTLIRIFNALTGALLQEVRRGANAAEIYSLAFCSTAQWLAVSSDKGTLHVFGLKVSSGVLEHEKFQSSSNTIVASRSSSLSRSFAKFKGVLPKYFSSEWSVAQFHLKEGCHSIVAFGHQKNTVIVLGMDGSFYRCQFDPVNGGDMTQLEHHNFLNPETAS